MSKGWEQKCLCAAFLMKRRLGFSRIVEFGVKGERG